MIPPGDNHEYNPDLKLTHGASNFLHRKPLGPQANAGDRNAARDNVLTTGLQDW